MSRDVIARVNVFIICFYLVPTKPTTTAAAVCVCVSLSLCVEGLPVAMAGVEPARARLGRIRCLIQAVESMKQGESLPEALCFVPKRLRLQCDSEEPVDLREQPKTTAASLAKLPPKKKHILDCEGQPVFNEDGGWAKLVSPHSGSWVLLQPSKMALKAKWKILDSDSGDPTTWLDIVERLFSLQLVMQAVPNSCDTSEIERLQAPPPGWGLEADEELARFLVEQGGTSSADGTVNGSEHFVRIEASSCDVSMPTYLTCVCVCADAFNVTFTSLCTQITPYLMETTHKISKCVQNRFFSN